MTVAFPNDDRPVPALLKEGEEALYRDEYSVAESLGEEALARVVADRDPALADEALALIADSRRLMGQFAHSWIALTRIVNLGSEVSGRESHALQSLSNFIECAIHLAFGRETIDELINHAETEAKTLEVDWLKSRIELQKSRVFRDRHEYDRAAEFAMKSFWYATRSQGGGHNYAMHCYKQAIARSMFDLGDVAQAQLRYQEILASSGASHWGKVCSRIGLSRICISRSQPEDAVGHANMAVAEAHYMNPLAVTYALEISYDAYQSAEVPEMAAKCADQLLFYTTRCDSVRRRYKALIRAEEANMGSADADAEIQKLAKRLIGSCGFAEK